MADIEKLTVDGTTYDIADTAAQEAAKDAQSTADAAKAGLTDGTVSKVGTATIGGTTQPIYLDAGTPKAMSGALATTYGGTGTTTGQAPTATKLATTRYIDGMGFDGSGNISHYATCSTTASTAAKVVSASGFSLVAGARVDVFFTNGNTADSITLNVNSTGSKSVYFNEDEKFSASEYEIDAGSIVSFVYDSDGWFYIINYQARYATRLGSSTIGSATKPMYLSDGYPMASGSTVGSGTKPIYLSSGTITVSSSTVGSGTNLIYMNSGTVTASSSTVGAGKRPVYLSGGTITACTDRWLFGTESITPSAANTPTGSKITFSTSFGSSPRVFTNASSSVIGTTVLGTSATDISTTGCTLYIARTNTTSTGVQWFAIGNA